MKAKLAKIQADMRALHERAEGENRDFTPEERDTIASFMGSDDASVPVGRDTFIRNLDPALYHRVRVQAVQQGMTVGEAINRAMALWLGIEERIER